MDGTISTRNIPQRIRRLAEVRKTPFLAIEKTAVRREFERFRAAMPGAQLFYAVKTNSYKRIIETLHGLGSGFEISSEQELALLLRCGVSPHRIISSNPVKSVGFIKEAYGAGVKYFAFDSDAEIKKLSECAPGSKVYVRLSVSNEGSAWPLSKKFGVETEQAVDLLLKTSKTSLVPYGITFHVGSQCLDATSWISAIEKSKLVWDIIEREGVKLRMLNIGGGFPIEYANRQFLAINQMAGMIREAIARGFPTDIELFLEPGRAFVGTAGFLVSTVIAKAKRNGENWLYLDVGVFNGLFESTGGILYSMTADRDGPQYKWVVAGPSCDSVDVISTEMALPELEIGDKVYISSAGAYTTAYASRFNGFPVPKTYYV